MSKVEALNTDLQNEDYESLSSLSEAGLAKLAQLVQWVKENSSDIIGTIESVGLTESQFASLKGYDILDGQGSPIPQAQRKWVLINGQSIAGSDYSVLTGISTLPPAVSNGAFLGQKRSSEGLMQYQGDSVGPHHHPAYETNEYKPTVGSSNRLLAYEFRGMTNYAAIASDFVEKNTGSETRPKNIRVNFFLKINN